MTKHDREALERMERNLKAALSDALNMIEPLTKSGVNIKHDTADKIADALGDVRFILEAEKSITK